MSDTILDSLPEKIMVDNSFLKKRRGAPTTLEKRRKSAPVEGRVRGKRSHYSDKEKMNAVCVFAVSGNSRRVAEITKIPEATIRAWKSTEWWNEILGRIHTEQDEELNSNLTKLINKAVDAVNDRIDHGDYIYDTRKGALVRKPVSARDLTVVTAISIDKRELLRGNPTSRVEKLSNDEHLNQLQEKFKQFAAATEVKQVVAPEDKQIEIIEADWEETEQDDPEGQDEFEEENEEEGLTVNEMFTE
jgi:hypothetical protein